MREASKELQDLAQQALPKHYIFRPSVYEINELIEENLKIRVLPTQKVSGGFGFSVYEKNKVNPIGVPFVKVNIACGDFKSSGEAIETGLIAVLKQNNK